jgi:putative oxidoreductase
MINFLFVFNNWALLLLRVVLGVILIYHGTPKIKDLAKTGKDFADMGFKPGFFWGALIAILEFVGGIFIIAGLFTQLIAVLLAVQFLVILITIKKSSSFKDIEFDLLLLATSILVATVGAGPFSIDHYFNLFLY